MAAVSVPAAFSYKWGENGTVDAMDDSQYKTGWAFIGATPPSVEQFNKVLQTLDEKINYVNSRRIGGLSGFVQLTGGTGSIAANQVNQQLVISGASNVGTWALPPTADLLPGSTVEVYSAAGQRITLTSPTANIFGTAVTTGGVSSLVLPSQTNQTIVWTGTYWLTTNNSAAGTLETFGFKVFPDGLILQWLNTSLIVPGSQLITLPGAFPNAKLGAMGCPGASGVNANSQIGVSIIGGTLGQLQVFAGSGASTAYILAWGK